MKAISEIYKQSMGPNSTLNSVPFQACSDVADEIHLKRTKVGYVEIVLYNEYARLADEANIAIDIDYAFTFSNFKYFITKDKPVPSCIKNTPYVFDIIVYDKTNQPLFKHRVVAKGGCNYTLSDKVRPDALPFSTFEEVKKWFVDNPGKSFIDFCAQADDVEELKSLYHRGVNLADIACLHGLRKNGRLDVPNKDIYYYRQARNIWLHDENFLSHAENSNRVISAYSYAISEQVMEKAMLIAAPSLCTTAVIWSIILYITDEYDVPPAKMIDAFCAAGIFASLVDKGASIAPIDVGCQGPMGTACGMAAVIAAVAIYDAKIDECGRAFEMALEHSLGIICDASNTYPIIPCIQRCASFATRAFEIAILNHSLMKTPELCKLDDVIKTIGETGQDLVSQNRRIGVGGFAEHAKYSLNKPTEDDWK